MATLREYYSRDFSRIISSDRDFLVHGEGFEVQVRIRLHFDHEANGFFASAFIPANPIPLAVFQAILEGVEVALKEKDQVVLFATQPSSDSNEMLDSRTLQFTGRLFIYYAGELPTDQVHTIENLAKARNYLPIVRTERYRCQRIVNEKPLAFVSHDGRDKESIARPIAMGLIRFACPVWYDEFSLRVGDRLRESIEEGLKECHRCILVVSKYFLENGGWTKTEFDSVFTREILERKDVILPVWAGVTREEVYEYSPSLANRVALNWGDGEDQVIAKLHGAIIVANRV